MDANKLPSLAALAVCTGANERSMVSSPKGEEEPAPAGAHGPSVFPLLFRSTSFLGFLKYIYIYILAVLGLCCCMWAFSSCGEQRLLSSCGAWAPHCCGFSCCRTWAQSLWLTGLVALRPVWSSWTRDRTCVPCIGRQILNHWTIREVLNWFLMNVTVTRGSWGLQIRKPVYLFWVCVCLEVPFH